MNENNFIEIEINNDNIKKIFGNLDNNIKIIEKKFDVSIIVRNNKIKIIGDDNIFIVKEILLQLEKFSNSSEEVTEQNINYIISLYENNNLNKFEEIDNEIIGRTFLGKPIKPKTLGQKEYINSIKNNMITYGIGPAGTGKTYLGMCMAVQSFKNNEVQRLVLTRPAIEAGEKLGFLPGDLQSKIDPYLRPLYDALYQMLGVDSFNANLEKGIIEIAPLAYMRGRTLDNAFIVLDEAQNTTIPQMKMFLTRIGFNSKVIITGDETQIDLDNESKSGLIHAEKVLKNIPSIEFVKLTSDDVVRHPIVQKIVQAYDKYEHKFKNNKRNDSKYNK